MLLLALAFLVPIALAGYPPRPGPWTLGAYHPPSDGDDLVTNPPWFGETIHANNGRFYMGKQPSASCPATGVDCAKYPGGRTILQGGVFEGTNGTLELFVGGPGIQKVYIAPDGALAYTSPGGSVPAGALVEGWNRQISDAWGGPTVLSYGNQLSAMGCRVPGQDGVWQIFWRSWVNIPAGCKTFQARTYSYYEPEDWVPVAWEYQA